MKTLTEAQVETLRVQKLRPRADVSVPRQLAVLRPGQSVPPPEEDDDFFEVTEGDLKAMALSPAPPGGAQPLQTAAMRELSRLQAIKSYSHALVRVRLPNGLIVQAAFHPQEPVANVVQLVASCLRDEQRRPFYLFTAPPRVVLDTAQSLVEAGLVPAATAILAWKTPAGESAALSAEELLAPEALASLAEMDAANEQVAFPTACNGAGGAAPPKRALDATQRTPQAADAGSSSDVASAGATGEKPKGGQPKWLRR